MNWQKNVILAAIGVVVWLLVVRWTDFEAQFESLPVITEPIPTGATIDLTITYAPITAVSAGGQSHRGHIGANQNRQPRHGENAK